jgi:hypothetical protein
MKRTAILFLLALALQTLCPVASANLIKNGDFETGALPPWEVLLGEVSVESVGYLGLFSPCSGNHMAVLSPDTERSAALVQTGIQTTGSPLLLSFCYNLISFNEGDTPASDYAEVYFNDEVVASAYLTDSLGGFYSETGWQRSSMIVTPGSEVGSWLGFVLWNDEQCDESSPEQRAMVLLDDVTLIPVPDGGATGPLLAMALAAMVLSIGRTRMHPSA